MFLCAGVFSDGLLFSGTLFASQSVRKSIFYYAKCVAEMTEKLCTNKTETTSS